MAKSKRKSARQPIEDENPYLPPKPAEHLLIQHLTNERVDSALCTTLGRGQLAGFLASQNPQATVSCPMLDAYAHHLADEYWKEADDPPQLLLTPDFPDGHVDLVALPLDQKGVAELTRDFIQQAHLRLKIGGKFIAAVNNPQDQWVHQQLKSLFPKVTRITRKQGVIYEAKKQADLKKVKDYSASFTIPIEEDQVELTTRPGVFSHRRADEGGWALAKAINGKPGQHLLDLGCGCGLVGIYSALMTKDLHVRALDSHVRATQCTMENAERCELPHFEVECRYDADLGNKKQRNRFDIVAANPPYFSNYRISELFIQSANYCLKPTGRMLIVTKTPDWYRDKLPEYFQSFQESKSGHYLILEAVRPIPHE